MSELVRKAFGIIRSEGFSTFVMKALTFVRRRAGARKGLIKMISRNNLMKGKIKLIDFCFKDSKNISSFADLGGVWGVDGGYTFHILSNYYIKKAYLFDLHISEIVFSKAINYPQLKLYELDFGSDEAVSKISNVDVILLFDVLLHQVNPDWDEVLAKYAPKTNYFVTYNPQFDAEKTVRLLDLGKEEYFKQIPHKPTDTHHYGLLFTDRDGEVRNSRSIWQWGITDDDLRNVMKKLNFKEIHFFVDRPWGKSKFTSKGFIFKKVKG